VQQSQIEHFHGLQPETTEQRAHLFPEFSFAAKFLPHGPKQGTGELLDLVHQERLCGAHSYVAFIQQTPSTS